MRISSQTFLQAVQIQDFYLFGPRQTITINMPYALNLVTYSLNISMMRNNTKQ